MWEEGDSEGMIITGKFINNGLKTLKGFLCTLHFEFLDIIRGALQSADVIKLRAKLALSISHPIHGVEHWVGTTVWKQGTTEWKEIRKTMSVREWYIESIHIPILEQLRVVKPEHEIHKIHYLQVDICVA